MSKSTKSTAAAAAVDQTEAQRLVAEQSEADRPAAEQAEADRLAAEQAEADRLAAEQAEAQRRLDVSARLATLPVDVLMLRRDCIDGTWYSAGDVLVGLPHERLRALVVDGAVDDSVQAIDAAIEGGAAMVMYVQPVQSEQPDDLSTD